MKSKIYLLIAVGSLAFMAPSCKKGLEEHPYSSLAASSVFGSEDGLKKTVFGIYDGYVLKPWLYQFFYFSLTETGHQYASFGTGGAGYDIDLYYRFAETPSSTAGSLAWTQMYTIISRANSVIANAPKVVKDEAAANKYIAEAKVLRGYAYFNLVRLFGNVPIVVNEITSLSQKDDIFGARKSVDTVYSLIVNDLTFGEANLPNLWTGNDVGRVSSGIAKAILGKVYITMAGKPLNKTDNFAKAADKLKEIVGTANENKYGFGLLDDFASVFPVSNERNKEFVLTFGQFYNSSNTNANIMPFFFLPFEQNIFGLSYKLYELYEPGDTRRDVTTIPSIINANDGHMLKYDQTQPAYVDATTNKLFGLQRAGIAYGKYDRTFRSAGAPPWGYNTDYSHMRFSDALLLLAEALNESNKPAEALPYLNRVRARAHASILNITDQAQLRAAIRKERRLELTGEHTTVFDIRRWGTLQAEIAAMSPNQIQNKDLNPYDPKLELYPVPQQELNANPALVQNPGWQ